ncbi:MAG: hypothetical protein ACYTEN_03220, partial [Planctomycetota bacterium]
FHPNSNSFGICHGLPLFSTYSIAIKLLKAGKNTHISSSLQEKIRKYRHFIKKTAFCSRQERHLFVFLNLRPNYNRAFGAIFGPF